jgi:hypothetical protein
MKLKIPKLPRDVLGLNGIEPRDQNPGVGGYPMQCCPVPHETTTRVVRPVASKLWTRTGAQAVVGIDFVDDSCGSEAGI